MDRWLAVNDPDATQKAAPDYDDAAWSTMQVPGAWEKAGLPDFDGLVWFRKELDIPDDGAGLDLPLHLGVIKNADTVWFNGMKIGGKDEASGERTFVPERNYVIPGKLVKAGRNVLALRVLNTSGPGGFLGKAAQLSLEFPTPDLDPLPLAGAWQYQAAVSLAKASPFPVRADTNPNRVTVSSPTVPAPTAVRYAWADNPVCNLYNAAGLPAVPFRTDR
jgi:sialate O-acetylesterase